MSKRILIVEDDIFTRMELEMILEQAGYAVAGSVSGIDQALELAGRVGVDAAIVDLGLINGEKGLTLARALRERHDVPSLLISGCVEASIQDEMAAIRPLGIVGKPFDKRFILTALGGTDRS